jgi:hypothetical protein
MSPLLRQKPGGRAARLASAGGDVTTVPPGTFSVKVNLQGFKESQTSGVAVTEGGAVRVSSSLEVGDFGGR